MRLNPRAHALQAVARAHENLTARTVLDLAAYRSHAPTQPGGAAALRAVLVAGEAYRACQATYQRIELDPAWQAAARCSLVTRLSEAA